MSLFWTLSSWIVPLIVGTYLYILIRRLLSVFPPLANSKWRHILPVLPALSIGFWCSNLFSERFMLLAHFLVVCLLTELLNLIFKRIRRLRYWNFLYRTSLFSLLVCGIYLIYGFANMQHVIDTTYTLQSDQMDTPVKLAFVSDVHMGTAVSLDKLQSYCDRIAAQNVDMVLLGGDIVDESTTPNELEGLAKAFGKIPCSQGVYYIFGNHDSFFASFTRNAAIDGQDVRDVFAANNITILDDEAVTLDNGIRLIGRSDAAFYQDRKRKSLDDLLEDEDAFRFTILLDHQPLELERAAQRGVDLMLSGHTHGGQIWPGGLINRLAGTYELLYGSKTVGSMTAITSSGMGGWSTRLRTGSHSEIVYVTIQ